MTQEDKKLLFTDLCGRLPYGVQLKCVKSVSALWGHDITLDTHWLDKLQSPFHEFKPYLFPMSSMTEEQYNEMHNYCYNAEIEASKFSNGELKIIYNYEFFKFDYLNRNHFDYRGLIPMGLAKDATGLNIY